MSFLFAGNQRIVDSALHFAADKHFPHAIIIDGNQGTGKHTLARFIANSTVCLGDNSPCGVCKACLLTVGKNHPDIITIAPEDNKKTITVAQIRALRDEAFVKPHMASGKVLIIDKAHLMNAQCQNALLKVLEEPPKNVIFILISENANSLLPTVLSRCVLFNLVTPETSEAADYIRQTTNYSIDEILSALEKSRNNIGLALSVLSSKDNKISIAAEFSKAYFENKGDLALLKILFPLEKDRVKTQEFVKELKIILTEKLRVSYKNPRLSSKAIKVYDTLCEIEPLLITNVNLSLFLSAFVSKIN